ncbi:MAG: acyl-CoA hydratase [Deltaproteobacteria bacterium]|jgi:crotonobetainyl-CoA:carnitine CoA-transferase CaiB-like acyl-CoA transferase|nr:acyl-CoA hydratase [Deltaproteobacteria bacterium]
MESGAALTGLRILELGGRIAAPYAAKLLSDLGADVLKIEAPDGDPLRASGPFPRDEPGPDSAGLFRYLNAGKRSASLDLRSREGSEAALGLAAEADLVLESFRPGTLESFGLGPEALRELSPHLALVRISSFGQTGPYRDLPATDLVLQAAGGWVAAHDGAADSPVRMGGRLPEYVAGAFAAASGLSAVEHAQQRAEFVSVDLSMLECLVGTLSYPMLLAEAMGRAKSPPEPARYVPFGIQPCRDGWVGINILTQAHWAAACDAMGAPEFVESRGEVTRDAADYAAFSELRTRWLETHTAEEVLEQCQSRRIPTAIVCDGLRLVDSPQLTARGFLVKEAGGAFLQPGPPYRLGATPARPGGAAPTLASAAELPSWVPRGEAPRLLDDEARELPFEGLRVLDLGTFWAGPYLGMYLASLGADVVKVESVQRPDGFRFIASADPGNPLWYEVGSLFQATNLGKRGVTLDLRRDEGRALLLRLVERSDLLIENYAPRVMERFELDWPRLRATRPDLVMVRMPAYGLEGPRRDHVGWAMAIAQAAGISWLTGDPADDKPRNPGAFLDPTVAMHAAVAVQAALAHRRRTGEGQQIEVAQIETAVALCPEPVIDASMNGRAQHRRGNPSSGMAPQGVYPCRDGRVALSVRDDAEWKSFAGLLGRPDWEHDTGLSQREGRSRRHDELDTGIAEWTGAQGSDAVVEVLRARGIPVAAVLVPPRIYGEPQLEARRYFQSLDHPVSGPRRYPVWPMRFSFAPAGMHPSGPPTLGQHNEEVLGGLLAVSGKELTRLQEEAVIGERWSAASG